MLEATFFGVMLLRPRRVSPRFYFVACCMVAIGTLFSSFWILAANSWMQTPVGHANRGRQDSCPTSGCAVIFDPSCLSPAAHRDGGVRDHRVCGDRHRRVVRLRGAIPPRAAHHDAMGPGPGRRPVPVQVVLGDLHGLYVLAHQPEKFAAIEASGRRAPAGEVMIGCPTKRRGESRRMSCPSSQLVRRARLDPARCGPGRLSAGRPSARCDPVFFGFRIMVGMGR